MIDLSRHPCFNKDVKGQCGRVHLPVAPKCNIMCNYCNRKYDCVNESRPGVTSAVLSPRQAMLYMEKVLEKAPNITVVGIAGPGDPFANPKETLETVRLIREKWPEMIICLSSNGLNVPPYLDELKRLEVSHVTITCNAVDPEIGKEMYSWIRDGKVVYRGLDAAKIMLERQLASIKGLKERGIVVKVNCIVCPGVNDHHVEAIAAKMKELGVDLLNLMPLHPNADTKFENVPEPTKEQIDELRAIGQAYLPQMTHCQRCRADAVGLLENDLSGGELGGCMKACSETKIPEEDARPYVAVATLEGMLVNLHLGEAESFQIWGKKKDGSGFEVIEDRPAPDNGGGPKRWLSLAEALKDCRAVLVAGIGDTPREILTQEGVRPVEMTGFIEEGLAAIYDGRAMNLDLLRGRKAKSGGGCKRNAGCTGSGEGC